MFSIVPDLECSSIDIFKDEHCEELNYPILFYRHPQNDSIIEKISCHQIAIWKILYKNHNSTINIQNIYFLKNRIYI